MYIVTIREKGKGKPLLERECDCVIGAFGSAGEAHCVTGIQGKRQTLIDTYASVLLGLRKLEAEFPGLVDQAAETAKKRGLSGNRNRETALLAALAAFWQVSGVDRWEVRHDLYEDVEVEAEDRLRAIIAAAKIWGVRWLPIAQECRTKKLGPVKEAGAYGKAGAV